MSVQSTEADVAAPAMDSKAMADSFLEALQNGASQPAPQDAPATGLCPALMQWVWHAHVVLSRTAHTHTRINKR